MANARSSRFASVRLRLTLWNVGVVALILVILGLTVRYTLQATLTQSLDRGMSGFAGFFEGRVKTASSLEDALPPRMRRPPPRPAVDARGNTDPLGDLLRRPTFLGLNGQPAIKTMPSAMLYRRGFEKAAHGVANFQTIEIQRIRVRVLSYPLTKDGHEIAVLQLGQEMHDPVDHPVDALTRVLLTMIPLGIMVAGIAGAFLTRRAMQPVRSMTSAASRIEAQNLSDRLDASGEDEFSTLAATFNGMLDRLEQSFRRLEQMYEQQRQFTGDASHELRTPLTIIKANASLALARPRTKAEYVAAIKTVDEAADRTNRILQDLLLLARADAGQLDVRMEAVNLSSLLEDAAALYRKDAGPSVLVGQIDPSLAVRGSAGMLSRVFENLLSNAARHTPPSGEIRVSADWSGDKARVVVSDTGEGIDADHLPRLTERFYRADPARSRMQGGTGLGLAICQSIVDAHRGRMQIESKLGAGTTVTITLPVAELTAAKARPTSPALLAPERSSRAEAA